MKRFNILLHNHNVLTVHADVVRLGTIKSGDRLERVRAFFRQGKLHATLPTSVIKRFKVTTPTNTFRPQ